MNKSDAKKIIERIDHLPLYLHAYAYHLNMRLERILPHDLLDIAKENHLTGVKIHMLDGETRSLGQLNDHDLNLFKLKAQQLNLDIHIETSSSEKNQLDDAVNVANKVGATSVRFYPRYEGCLKDVLNKIDQDILYLKNQYGHLDLNFTIEQHEDLKGYELVDIVERSGMERLSILFDFGNMINANEQPLDALQVMSRHITEVHMKDALIIKENKGFGHKACRSGEGDMPFKEILTRLICLGDDKPQVIAYGLEEEVDYYAPAFRFDDEGDNPWIPWRQVSETPLPQSGLEQRLIQEKEDALRQLNYVRKLMQEIKQQAQSNLLEGN